MKRKFFPFLIITLAVILFGSCRKSNGVINGNGQFPFSFQQVGGWSGLNENLKISTTSTYYSISYNDLNTGKAKNYETTIRTPDELWNNLTKTFDLGTFIQIKDGDCRSCVDGTDEIFSYTNLGKTYSVYNGDADKNFQQMQDFFNLMYEQINNFRTLAGVQ
ncbi:MAG: hypothetical protein LBE82_11175 [Chitinophagaceae bacterium]|jgi:hypothetical protein|nr:hypothetical protein [Chitinophagaceae bacterium]